MSAFCVCMSVLCFFARSVSLSLSLSLSIVSAIVLFFAPNVLVFSFRVLLDRT